MNFTFEISQLKNEYQKPLHTFSVTMYIVKCLPQVSNNVILLGRVIERV